MPQPGQLSPARCLCVVHSSSQVSSQTSCLSETSSNKVQEVAVAPSVTPIAMAFNKFVDTFIVLSFRSILDRSLLRI